jgi:hypothetical protein
LSNVAYDMGKSLERANQVNSRSGLASGLDCLEQRSLRLSVAPFSACLPCRVDYVFNAIHWDAAIR